jgi:hypothetical protein
MGLLPRVLRQNQRAECLDLSSNALGSLGLARIATVVYRHSSIKILDVSCNGFSDMEFALVLRNCIRRSKTITSLRASECFPLDGILMLSPLFVAWWRDCAIELC